MASRERTYGGSTLSARRAQRRMDLVEATLDLVGEGGSAAVSVRSVCRKAGLTDRYFYESFANRDELLVAVFTEVAEEAYAQATRVIEQVEGSTREKAREHLREMVAMVVERMAEEHVAILAAPADPAPMPLEQMVVTVCVPAA